MTKNEAYKILDDVQKINEQGGVPGPETRKRIQEAMATIAKKEENEWCTVLNDLGHDIERHARDEFDTFLEKCLKPYGISKENAYRNANRVSIEKEVFPDANTTYLRFYIDHEYKFTISIAQKPDTPVTPERYYARVAVYYRKIFEGDVIQNTEDWIPVSKSLPDKISNIWITIEYNGIRETKPAKFIPQESPHFYYAEGKPVTDAKILAWRWRNTPVPYLGKEKQNE